jgi:uncharacterized protein (TIGR00255 family)
MPFSMTAFSRATGQTPWGEITCELRSVNHRYLEINPHLAEEVRSLEPRVRDAIAKQLKRGRVDCTIRLQQQEMWSGDIDVDMALIDKLVAVSQQVRDRAEDIKPLRAADVLRWPGVVRVAQLDEDQIGSVAVECLERATRQLVEIRKREGERLLESLLEKLHAAKNVVNELKQSIPQWQQLFRQRVEKRLAEARVNLDQDRLEQEMLIYIQKSDVTEEMDRLDVHLNEVSNVFELAQPIGRRLDFLMQELTREANTLGSKSNDTRLTQASVDLKVLIEQMREQVQNIE